MISRAFGNSEVEDIGWDHMGSESLKGSGSSRVRRDQTSEPPGRSSKGASTLAGLAKEARHGPVSRAAGPEHRLKYRHLSIIRSINSKALLEIVILSTWYGIPLLRIPSQLFISIHR